MKSYREEKEKYSIALLDTFYREMNKKAKLFFIICDIVIISPIQMFEQG